MDIVFPFVGLYMAVYLTDRFLASKKSNIPVSDHFNGKIFKNIDGDVGQEVKQPHLMKKSVWVWMLRRPKSDWLPKESPGVPLLTRQRVSGGELVVTYVNHSTVLIQTEGLNILTDPIWSKRASPFRVLGPKRFAPPGMAFEDLPPIDIVLVSHNHYDHMDIATLRRLAKKWDPKIIVPTGNKTYLEDRNFTRVVELNWWDKEEVNEGMQIVCVPAQHFSSRAFSDRNRTLWAGFVIETLHGNIYFAGDTGYGPFVEKIKEQYNKFRLALLPIGAYKPEWFMGSVHISPDEAIRMHRELSVRTTIGMHFGTFRLADDLQEEPPRRIRELLEVEENGGTFVTLENGEEIVVE